MPVVVDLREKCPPVYNQGQLGSCTGNAIAGAYQFDLLKQGKTDFNPSRLFIYYNERAIEGTINSDSGAQIRDGLSVLNNLGVCDEICWPYDIQSFTQKPSQNCFDAAAKNKITQYERLNNRSLFELKQCLAGQIPFVLGFRVFESFESDEVAKSGVVSLPSRKEKVLGGHAVLCVGYNEEDKRFIIRNSWGEDWGQGGYFTIPYNYLTSNLASDFWCINKV